MTARQLNERQRRFVDAYLKEPNATQAAIAAGYSEKAAPTNGPLLLQNPAVKEIIAARTRKVEKLVNLDVERIVSELSAIGFSDVTQLFDGLGRMLPVKQWPKEIALCVSSISTSRRVTSIRRDPVKAPPPDALVSEDTPEGELVEEAEIITKVRLWPKVQALAVLAQYRKMIGGGPVDPNTTPGAPGGFQGLQVIVAAGGTLALQVNQWQGEKPK